jgi:enoyl-CoA hydratase/carnithine racemase
MHLWQFLNSAMNRGGVTFKTLRVESNDAITTIFLNRPSHRNSLTREMIDELRALIEQLRGEETTRAIILTGAGKVFSVGADPELMLHIGETFVPEQTREELSKWRATFSAFETLPQMTIAAINGAAFGAGLVLALACDFRLASVRAILGLNEIKLGLVLALGGTRKLTRLVGVAAAKDLILRGRNVAAMDAQRMGLLHRISEPGDLMGLARNWAERSLEYSPRALSLAKQLIDQSFDQSADESAAAEVAAQSELLHAAEFIERVKSLKENGEL